MVKSTMGIGIGWLYRVQAWIFWFEPDRRTKVNPSTRRPVGESKFLTLLGLLLSTSGLTTYFRVPLYNGVRDDAGSCVRSEKREVMREERERQ